MRSCFSKQHSNAPKGIRPVRLLRDAASVRSSRARVSEAGSEPLSELSDAMSTSRDRGRSGSVPVGVWAARHSNRVVALDV